MEVWEYLVLFLAVLGGGGLAYAFKRRYYSLLRFALSFSGAYLLAVVLLLLLPQVFQGGGERVGLWILAGFVLQLILESLSRGVEHGHLHGIETGKRRFGIILQVMLGLCIHAFLEGLPLELFPDTGRHGHQQGEASFFWGIVFHKVPAALALATLLYQSRVPNRVVWFCLLIFSVMSPLGAWSGSWALRLGDVFVPVLGIVSGSFLHISTTILFESEESQRHRLNWHTIAFVLLGFASALLSLLA